MGSFQFMDIILMIGIAQGFFLSITLPIIHQKNTAANTILSVQLLLACFMLFAKMAMHSADEVWVIKWFGLFETFIFLYGPFGYIYLKRLLTKNQKTFWLPWAHFLPAFLYFSFLLIITGYSDEELVQHLGAGTFNTPFFIAESAALLFNCYYWYLSMRLFGNYKRSEKQQLSFTQETISFVRVILWIVGLLLCLWIISYVSSYLFQTYLPLLNYNAIWIVLPILIYAVGYYALKQPEIFRVVLKPTKSKTVSKHRLDDALVEDLTDRLETLMEKDRVYLDNTLTLAALAQQLHTSTNNLSWLLNNIYKNSFYDYINQHRIAAFERKIKNREHQHKTLFSMCLEVGFNSKSTFNKAFKEVLHETPSSYIKKVER